MPEPADSSPPEVRRGQGDLKLSREEFSRRLAPARSTATSAYEPYATSHQALDRDDAVQEEVRNVSRSVVNTVRLMRQGRRERPDEKLQSPRPK